MGDRVDVEDIERVRGPRCAEVNGFSLHAMSMCPPTTALASNGSAVTSPAPRSPRSDSRYYPTEGSSIAFARLAKRSTGRRVHAARAHREARRVDPPPQANLVRYHGVFAPASKLRQQVIHDRRKRTMNEGIDACDLETSMRPPTIPQDPTVLLATGPFLPRSPRRAMRSTAQHVGERITATKGRLSFLPHAEGPKPPTCAALEAIPEPLPAMRPRRLSWRELMRRVFQVDVLRCPRPTCGGRMKIIAEITDPFAAKKILEAMKLPSSAPPVCRARPPPVDFDEQST